MFASPHFFSFQAMVVPSLPLGENIFASVNPTEKRGLTNSKIFPDWEFSMLFGSSLRKSVVPAFCRNVCLKIDWFIWFKVSDWPAHSGYSASLLRHWQNYAHITSWHRYIEPFIFYLLQYGKNLMQYEPINPSSKLHRKKEKRWARAQRDDFKNNFLSKYEVFSRP